MGRQLSALKVCMVYPFEFPATDRWEGSRTRLFSFCRGLVGRGVEVHVLAKRDPSADGDEYEGVQLHHFRELGGSAGVRSVSSALIGPQVMRLGKEHRFHLIHSHLPIAGAGVAGVKPFLAPKTAYDPHDWFKLDDELYFNFPRLPPRLSRAVDGVERRVARKHDGLLVTTPLLSGVAGRKQGVFVVPNAVDVQHFRPGRSSFRERNPTGGPVILFLGFVAPHQGLWELMKAVKSIPKSGVGPRLLVIGGGFVDRAAEEAARLGISDRVTFTGPGRVPYGQVPDLINAADVAVSPLQPLPRYHEYAQPLKVLEYMACEKPVVVTPLKEQARLVQESEGGVVARGFGASEISEALRRVLESENSRMGESGRRYVSQRHSEPAVLDSLLAAYEELTG